MRYFFYVAILFTSFCWGQQLTISKNSRVYVVPDGMTVAAMSAVTLQEDSGLVNSSVILLPAEGYFKLNSANAYLEAEGIGPETTANFMSGISHKAQIDVVLTQGVVSNFNWEWPIFQILKFLFYQ